MERRRIALEPRSGIWLMFYEVLALPYSKMDRHKVYEQQLLRIFKDFDSAEKAAILKFRVWQISAPLIVRDDSERDKVFRQA